MAPRDGATYSDANALKALWSWLTGNGATDPDIDPPNVDATGTTSLGKAEDAPHVSGDTGIPAWGVRKDTAAALAGTDGDYAPLEVDANGRLHVNQSATGTATHTADNTITNASEVILAANASRKGAIVQVVSGGNARVTIDGVDATTTLGLQLVAGGSPLVLGSPHCPTTALKAIREGTVDAVIQVVEIV